VAATIS